MYATVVEFNDHYGTSNPASNLAAGEHQRILRQAATDVNRVIGRSRTLAVQTVTSERFDVADERERGETSRHLHVPDHPPFGMYSERWSFTLSALAIYDYKFALESTVTVGEVTLWPKKRGLLYLPDTESASDTDNFVATYTCGYGRTGSAITPTAAWSTTARIATCTATAHGLAEGDVVLVTGVTPAVYDGLHEIDTALDANSFTVALDTSPADSTAHGTVTPVYGDIPSELRTACLYFAEVRVLAALQQVAPSALSQQGVAQSRARDVALPFADQPIATRRR